MNKCSKCGNAYKKLIKGSRQCPPCRNARLREYTARTGYHKKRYQKEKYNERERHTIRKYGICQKKYNEMFDAQGGKCAICLRAQEKNFDIDHCHKTKKVRGLLCTNCNRMLGYAKDNRITLKSAIIYLSFRKSRQNS